ncbi:DUF6438 domain-containing protein [Arenimonas terrae]|uniref:DUF6438 domain-containing protein n=1 Tax=Arenimonas terrae TaxID=2546226 RepID=A0A5C4RQC0_9GAMM|nr:DUF6438 domain-containing protein [Arenimonas terrae]TNJ33129.1 hypothetical protein E1B00_12555 [Arenimonas terrae]
MRVRISIAASLLLTGCATTGEFTAISVDRLPGYGNTPSYTVEVRRDGSVKYEGRTNVKEDGVEYGSITTEDWILLEAALSGSGFSKMQDSYGNSSVGCTSTWNHHPTIKVTVTRGQSSKTVSYYTGCWGLREGSIISWLADTTDMVAGSGRWVYETLEDF